MREILHLAEVLEVRALEDQQFDQVSLKD